jgi:hypothetical protein
MVEGTMGKAKVYEIDSFEKLVNVVNEENFERLTKDLILWLNFSIELKKAGNLKFRAFLWTDDGKIGLTHVKLTNDSTGEVKTLKIKNK